jgi:hypothetical protein
MFEGHLTADIYLQFLQNELSQLSEGNTITCVCAKRRSASRCGRAVEIGRQETWGCAEPTVRALQHVQQFTVAESRAETRELS